MLIQCPKQVNSERLAPRGSCASAFVGPQDQVLPVLGKCASHDVGLCNVVPPCATVQQLMVQSNLLCSKMFQAVKMRNVMGSNSCHNLTQVQCKIETCPRLSGRVLNRYQCSQLWKSAPCAPAALPSCDAECYRLDRATVICGHFVPAPKALLNSFDCGSKVRMCGRHLTEGG